MTLLKRNRENIISAYHSQFAAHHCAETWRATWRELGNKDGNGVDGC
jgi:hypothetical protein